MTYEKQITAKEATIAVLKKVEEVLKKSELFKSEDILSSVAGDRIKRGVGYKERGDKVNHQIAIDGAKQSHQDRLKAIKDSPNPKLGKSEEQSKHPIKEDTTKLKAANPVNENDDQNAENQHIQGKANGKTLAPNSGEIHPKEHVEGKSDNVRSQIPPGNNPKENAEGNNEKAGTTPTQVGQDGKNIMGFDEIKGHLKLAKFIGYMHGKRSKKIK